MSIASESGAKGIGMNPPIVKTIGDRDDSQWLFRLIQQVSQLSKGALLTDDERTEFGTARLRLVEILRQCADARRELWTLADKHVAEVIEGQGVFVNESGALVIEDDITPRLNRIVNGFFVPTRTALYHLCGQKAVGGKKHAKAILEILTGMNFGFVFIFDQTKFEKAAKGFLDGVPGVRSKGLIDTIRADRDSWILGLQEIRDTIIHDTEYDGLKMIYQTEGRKVQIGFPRLKGVPIFDFVEMFWNNNIDFCEEMMMMALSTRMPPTVALDRIPADQPAGDRPYRWQGILLDHPMP